MNYVCKRTDKLRITLFPPAIFQDSAAQSMKCKLKNVYTCVNVSHPSYFSYAETSRPCCRKIPPGPACNVDDATGVSSLLMCASGTD